MGLEDQDRDGDCRAGSGQDLPESPSPDRSQSGQTAFEQGTKEQEHGEIPEEVGVIVMHQVSGPNSPELSLEKGVTIEFNPHDRIREPGPEQGCRSHGEGDPWKLIQTREDHGSVGSDSFGTRELKGWNP